MLKVFFSVLSVASVVGYLSGAGSLFVMAQNLHATGSVYPEILLPVGTIAQCFNGLRFCFFGTIRACLQGVDQHRSWGRGTGLRTQRGGGGENTVDASAQPKSRGIGLFPGFPTLEAAFIFAELILVLAILFFFLSISRQLSRYTDGRLAEPGASGGAALILAAPAQVWVGQEATAAELAGRLRNALYVEDERGSSLGTFKLSADSLEIHPGPSSYFKHAAIHEGPALLRFRVGRIVAIESLDGATHLQSYWLEPEIITSLSRFARWEQHLVRYQDVPPVLLHAVLAAEDHRFFSHRGINLVRLLGAAYIDVRSHGRAQGGSTLTMQLARNLFLSPRRTFHRKLQEIGLALFLETRLSKPQIFELYANRVYLGQQGNFGIFGFGDASQAYFQKDVTRLDLPEAALLAGVICAPNWYSPYKYPSRTLARRNYVLKEMADMGYITRSEADAAKAAPLGAMKPSLPDFNQQGYFADMVTEQLRKHFSERRIEYGGLKVYTTLDPNVQRAAVDAARVGAAQIDQQIAKSAKQRAAGNRNQPQISLVVLDPHSGEVKALIGGRDYGASELNHAVARRQPGSVFKPFVYAAALTSAVDGSQPVITPATLLDDQPTQFLYGQDQRYAPRDFDTAFHGTVTVRQALAESLNIPTVTLAQAIGYGKIRDLAIKAGFNPQMKATPSMALGSYVATPLEIAGSYTVFANNGEYAAPHTIVEVDDAGGDPVWIDPAASRRVLDARVNYLMVSLLESVVDNGTGWGVRSHGFRLPAAGKTGTSHDGWFAGFTSNLLAVTWIGYDNYRDIKLAGADSAVPLWTEFMKRATEIPAYAKPAPFAAPEGVVSVPVAIQTASTGTPNTVSVTVHDEYFVHGTEPGASGGGQPQLLLALDSNGQLETILPQPVFATFTAGEPPMSPALANMLPQTDQPPVAYASVAAQPSNALQPVTQDGTSNSPPQAGGLHIQTTPPNLQVFVDAQPAGSTPLTLREPAGTHSYRIVLPSGKMLIERTVQIAPGTTENVDIQY